MSTDLRFVQKYNEVVLENFQSVLKQNLMFQTQIGILEEQIKVQEDFSKIKQDVVRLLQENSELKSELNGKNLIIKNSSDTDGERHRLQTALNKQSKELSSLTVKVDEQTEYIKQLEDMLPNSKKKKLGITVTEEKTAEKEDQIPTTINDDVLKVESAGGNF